MHRLTELEARLMQNLVASYREAAQSASRAEAAIRAAIAALCAAHSLEGNWRISDDMASLIRVDKVAHADDVEVIGDGA